MKPYQTTAQNVADDLSTLHDFASTGRVRTPFLTAVWQEMIAPILALAFVCFIIATVLMAAYKLLAWVWG